MAVCAWVWLERHGFNLVVRSESCGVLQGLIYCTLTLATEGPSSVATVSSSKIDNGHGDSATKYKVPMPTDRCIQALGTWLGTRDFSNGARRHRSGSRSYVMQKDKWDGDCNYGPADGSAASNPSATLYCSFSFSLLPTILPRTFRDNHFTKTFHTHQWTQTTPTVRVGQRRNGLCIKGRTSGSRMMARHRLSTLVSQRPSRDTPRR